MVSAGHQREPCLVFGRQERLQLQKLLIAEPELSVRHRQSLLQELGPKYSWYENIFMGLKLSRPQYFWYLF